MAFCSAVTLCFASIFSLVAAALLAIAFSTDNWQVVTVKRELIKDLLETNPNPDVSDKFNSSPLYFTRTRGLFRECFYGEKSRAPTDNEINMGRSMIALFIVAFFFMFVSFTTGVVGCWRTSPSNITASGVLMLLACLLSAGGMGLWHGVEHYEKMKITEKSDIELFVKAWPKVLTDNTEFKYDWSYIVSWVGVGMTLCSATLFALAAMCIKHDKEREEAMNMQYLMPVYPQKQQPYGPYGYAAYPGPAAYYGSQYGLPYNQY